MQYFKYSILNVAFFQFLEMFEICQSEDLYDKIVSRSAALLLQSLMRQELVNSLEKTMIEATLIDSGFTIPILMDIWIIFLR